MDNAIGYIVFALVIYLIVAMPSKRDVRRLASPDGEARRAQGLKTELAAKKGEMCTLDLVDMSIIGLAAATGTIVDIDDEWVLVEMEGKKGARKLVALRLSDVKGLRV